MKRMRVVVLGATVLATVAAGLSPAPATARGQGPRTLLFDALVTHASTAGPGVADVGHRQIATGILRDAGGRPIGRFSFTCTWTRVTSGGALENCVAIARTRDGRLDASGLSRSSATTQHWMVDGGTGAYRAARGSLLVRDLSERESLITATVTPRIGAALHAATVSRPRANRGFIARADRLCRQAAGRLAALPPFPFHDFDPLHPDPSLLPLLGAFFTGPGDPRAILGTLNTGLKALGQPPANDQAWTAALGARGAQLSVIDQQDQAALAGDVSGFVRTVHGSSANFRAIAITANAFGATACAF